MSALMVRYESTRAHHGRCDRSTGRRSERQAAHAGEARPVCEPDVPDFAACLFRSVAVLIPAPTPGLASDDASWQAFEDLLDEAALFVVAALGSDRSHSIRALAARPWAEGPVHGALVARALGRLDPGHD